MAQPCFARFYTIVDSKHIELEDDMMRPKYVDVKLETIEPKCFWRGSQAEFAPKSRKRKPTQDSREGDLFVRKVAQRKPTEGSAASSSKPGIDRNDVCNNLDTLGVGATDVGASDYDIDMDPDFMPDIPPNSALDPDIDLEAVLSKLIEEMCPPEDEPDTKEEEADAGLLDDFFAAASAMCEDESDDEGPEGIMTSASGHAPCSGGDDGSSSSGSSSSSSSDSSSTSSDPKGKAKAKANPQHRELQTLQEAGGRSASAHDPSTVSIGPLKIVKRFYPVPCCSNWSSLRVYSVSSSSLMPSL